MWDDLLRAFALVLVLEGLLPLLAPDKWREMIANVARMDSRSLRLFGGLLLASGLILLHFLRP
ncbi:MAG: DUF2065 family protein [Salinisphaeraceae bacterium]|nr:DUF2065 family protein [Salinisphaeraceae bacterium]